MSHVGTHLRLVAVGESRTPDDARDLRVVGAENDGPLPRGAAASADFMAERPAHKGQLADARSGLLDARAARLSSNLGPAKHRPVRTPRLIGQMLLDRGEVEPGDLVKAIALRERESARIGDILVAHGWADEEAVIAALCDQWNARPVPLATEAPDASLLDLAGIPRCLAGGFVPWRRLAGATVIVTSRPERFAEDCADLPAAMGPFVMGLATENAIQTAILSLRRTSLARRAETRTPPDQSVRGMPMDFADRIAMGEDAAGPAGFGTGSDAVAAVAGGGLALMLVAPHVAMVAITLWSVVTLVLTSLLKLAAAIATRRVPQDGDAVFGPQVRRLPADRTILRPDRPFPYRLPIVSVILPLFGEDSIARRMIGRISRIDYPRELLDIVIVVEEEDTATRHALAALRLPRWMRTVTVPGGPIRTKPRALNFALDFCRGDIVGVWDAEDAPAPGQIHQVVRAFRDAPDTVACLQGILDFYNRDRNWVSRCFAIEYAAWFRVVLPGLRRLGLVLPLGGTTLFFRRDVLEQVGAWDAHNVTEDADLGLRLARHGYVTEIIPTVTGEEPNARVLSWVRQRSRWLKGYAMTWAVHMRSPRKLLADLGWWKFLGVQVLFLGTLTQFALAPVLWAIWLLPMAQGGAHGGMMFSLGHMLAGLFVASEAINMLVGFIGVRRAGHRRLMKWVPTMVAYFPLGTLAAVKALYEAVVRPFYWDKTAHGLADEETAMAPGPSGSPAAAPARAAAKAPARARSVPDGPAPVIALPVVPRRVSRDNPDAGPARAVPDSRATAPRHPTSPHHRTTAPPARPTGAAIVTLSDRAPRPRPPPHPVFRPVVTADDIAGE